MIQLTQSQQAAIEAFKEFLEGDEQVFILKGAAGTGKTTVVCELIKSLKTAKRPFALMAPTGRAAYILGSKTGEEAYTIHRSIYGMSSLTSSEQNKEEEDDDIGLFVKFGLKSNVASGNTVYFIDEASLISDVFSENEAFSFGSGRLLSDLFQYAGKRKLVFIGDYAQLPPVKMNFSPALDSEYLSSQFDCKVSAFMLREVVRQADGSCILKNANRVRESIENKTFIEFNLEKGDDSIAEDSDLLSPYFALSPDKPNVHAAIIAYSNRQALQYNMAIRRHYYGDNAPILNSGDLLMITRNNYAYGTELFNGSIVQVVACQPDNEVLKRTIKIKLGKDRFESIELRFRNATIRFGANGEPVSLNVTLLDNSLDDSNSTIGNLLTRALTVDFNNRLPQGIKSRYNEIRKLLRSKEKLTEAQMELRDSYIKLLQTDPYYNAVICKYGYAMTCHKAQGGEWENVFVDMCRFGGTANEDYFRWAYTALTRASKKIWHFRSPDFNYISNLVVEPIQLSKKIRVSTHSDGSDFREARFERILDLAQKENLSAKENKSVNYQHRISFRDEDNHSVEFSLWYNNEGYSNRVTVLHSDSDHLTAICQAIIDASYAPETVSYSNPGRPFAEKLVTFLKSQFTENGIQLLDITNEQYQDIFHLKTDGFAKVTLYYTDKGNYTYMRLISSLGEADEKLQNFRKRFI